MDKSEVIKDVLATIDENQLKFCDICFQLKSYSVLLKGFVFDNSQEAELAGLGIAIDKVANEIQESSDALSVAFKKLS